MDDIMIITNVFLQNFIDTHSIYVYMIIWKYFDIMIILRYYLITHNDLGGTYELY